MNGYDFDKTIYHGDSTAHFILWCVKKKPSLAFRLLPGGIAFLGYLLNRKTKTEFKEKMYGFLRGIKDVPQWVEMFWDEHEENIKWWYLDQKREDDIIISASPEFLLWPMMKRLGLTNLMASRVDAKTGKYDGENCYGEEKVRRFLTKFQAEDLEAFYSDSYSDAPMARLAKEAFLVEGDRVSPW